MKMRSTALLALFVVLVMAGPVSAADKVLHRATSSEPSTLDPHLALGNASSVIIDDLFAGLMSTAASGEIGYGLAESHTLDDSRTVYTFTLREGLTWSDGSPLTAEDVVYSMRRLMDPATAARYAANLYVIKNARAVNTGQLPVEELGVEAIDARTVVIELTRPAPFFLKVLGANALVIVPQQAIEAHGTGWARPGTIVTNGAYILTDWVANTRMVLARNPNFHAADSVAIDQVVFYPTDDLGTALKRYRAGELDIILGFPPEQLGFLKENYGDQINISPNLGLFYFAFNTERAPFDDARVRRALSMAVNREVIAEKLLLGLVDAAWGLVPPAAADYTPPVNPDSALAVAERMKQARELLAEAGFDRRNPLKVELRYDSKEEARQISVAIGAMWKAIGVETDLVASDFRAITGDIRRGDFDVIRYQWYAPYDDPTTFLNLARSGTRTNYSRYANPAYDAALDAAEAERDEAARLQALAAAEALVQQEYPLIPIYYAKAKRVVSPRVAGWKNVTGGNIPSRFLDVQPDS